MLARRHPRLAGRSADLPILSLHLGRPGCAVALGCGGFAAELVGLGLAVSRLANFCNDLFKRFCRPKAELQYRYCTS